MQKYHSILGIVLLRYCIQKKKKHFLFPRPRVLWYYNTITEKLCFISLFWCCLVYAWKIPKEGKANRGKGRGKLGKSRKKACLFYQNKHKYPYQIKLSDILFKRNIFEICVCNLDTEVPSRIGLHWK